MPAHHPVLLLGVINSIQSMQQRQMTRPHASRTRTKCGWAISTVFCCKLVSLLIGCQQIWSNFVSQKITPFRNWFSKLGIGKLLCFFRVHKEVEPHFCSISFPKEAFCHVTSPFRCWQFDSVLEWSFRTIFVLFPIVKNRPCNSISFVVVGSCFHSTYFSGDASKMVPARANWCMLKKEITYCELPKPTIIITKWCCWLHFYRATEEMNKSFGIFLTSDLKWFVLICYHPFEKFIFIITFVYGITAIAIVHDGVDVDGFVTKVAMLFKAHRLFTTPSTARFNLSHNGYDDIVPYAHLVGHKQWKT